jgi:hypothetical protein
LLLLFWCCGYFTGRHIILIYRFELEKKKRQEKKSRQHVQKKTKKKHGIHWVGVDIAGQLFVLCDWIDFVRQLDLFLGG